jgi:hypothetical protein
MLVVRSRNGVPVRLTEERWRHIVEQHPEMEGPTREGSGDAGRTDMIQKGDFGVLSAIRLYAETAGREVFLVAQKRLVRHPP